MSDMSSLSHEYASTTDFSHHVNQAVLLLKKRYVGNNQAIDTEELAKASQLVAGIVRRLLRRMGRAATAQEPDDAVVIPEDVLIRVEEKKRGNLEYFMDDLAKLDESLSRGAKLSTEEIELLDTICEVADASASATFRKLWRR